MDKVSRARGNAPASDVDDNQKRRRKKDLTVPQYLLALSLIVLVLWYSLDAWEKGEGKRKPERKLNIVPIPRIKAGSLTAKEFFRKYGDRTVIVEGEARKHPAFRLGFQGLKDLCGGGALQRRRRATGRARGGSGL